MKKPAHTRQRKQKRGLLGGPGTATAPHSSTKPTENPAPPSPPKEGLLKIVADIRAALDNDAKSVTIQSARLTVLEDFLQMLERQKSPAPSNSRAPCSNIAGFLII